MLFYETVHRQVSLHSGAPCALVTGSRVPRCEWSSSSFLSCLPVCPRLGSGGGWFCGCVWTRAFWVAGAVPLGVPRPLGGSKAAEPSRTHSLRCLGHRPPLWPLCWPLTGFVVTLLTADGTLHPGCPLSSPPLLPGDAPQARDSFSMTWLSPGPSPGPVGSGSTRECQCAIAEGTPGCPARLLADEEAEAQLGKGLARSPLRVRRLSHGGTDAAAPGLQLWSHSSRFLLCVLGRWLHGSGPVCPVSGGQGVCPSVSQPCQVCELT